MEININPHPTVPNSGAPIYIVSGGAGASGEQLVHTVLAQFPESQVSVTTVAHVRLPGQIEGVVAQAAASGGLIVHTLVETQLRTTLIELAEAQGVATLDLMGGLYGWLTTALGQSPLEQPGLYRRLNRAYFDRVAAIEFAIVHDDGKQAQDWPLAEIVLVGVSRVGKTPLSMFLSIQGWKVANYPLVKEFSPPPELFELDPRRVIGLDIEPGQLVSHRQTRQQRLRTPGRSDYADPPAIYEEVEAARRIYRRGGFTIINVTDKPIETSAAEITALMARRFGARTTVSIGKEMT